ncbi:recombinase family protein [Brevibacillus sp. NRS-1366]|uniref:recombinase family protein n=1 Tax=Brevibacillus sp. NRS-1366 TaxID=3233899 RepID=UPI003D1D1379
MKKRVWTLYRVSTKSQVDEGEDIALQRKSCQEYVHNKDNWEITREFYEKGVSGWKTSTNDRDALNEIKKAAEKNEFDVLLVFMFDRLGRREDETPLVIQFLCSKGIECWSVNEQQRKIENHGDKLMNYVTFWMASGESEKISMRVKEKMSQMQEENLWTGGNVPYGYELYDTEIKHPKKDKMIKEFRIFEEEAKIIRLIFDLVYDKGYGANRITQYLNELGHRPRKGKMWRQNSINRILRNPIYMGYRRYNVYEDDNSKVRDKDEWKLQCYREEYEIIGQEKFKKIQQIIDARLNHKPNSKAPVITKSNFLFTGLAFCGYCGHKLKADYSKKKTPLKNGGVYEYNQLRYCCHHGKNNKEGHETIYFSAIKFERSAIQDIFDHLEKLKTDQYAESLLMKQNEEIKVLEAELKTEGKKLKSMQNEIDILNGEVVNSLMGKSKFKPELLSSLIEKKEEEVERLKKRVTKIENEIKDMKLNRTDISTLAEEQIGWKEKFESMDMDGKKMMIAKSIKSITFKKDEVSNIDWRLNYHL